MATMSTSASSPTTLPVSPIMSTAPSRSSSFVRRYKKHVNASMPLTVTPVSTLGWSSDSPSPTPTSPRLTANGTTNTSIQPSPEGPRGRLQPHSPSVPLQLPDPVMALPLSSNAMSEAVALSKGPGLMRRISRGAANKLSRRRTSSSNLNRDHSSGPVVMRRRSESQGGQENGSEHTDLGRDVYEDEDEDDYATAESGALTGSEGTRDTPASPCSGTTMASLPIAGIGPVVPPQLLGGAWLQKITKNKKKSLKFVLDMNAAKVYWDPKNTDKQFYIDSIIDIRTGADARNYREQFGVPQEFEQRWFTILYADERRSKGRPTKTMHLIAPTDHDLLIWTTTLEIISWYRIDMMTGLAGQTEKAVKSYWQQEMRRINDAQSRTDDGDKPYPEVQRLNFEGVERLCRSLHINCSQAYMKPHFKIADKDHMGSLDFAGFKDFVRRVREREELREIFNAIAADEEAGLDKSEFFAFLQNVQGVDLDANRDHWESIYEKLARRSRAKPALQFDTDVAQLPRIKFEAFSAFLSSSANQALRPSRHELDRPLNEYFISSSHNTYLMGRQVAGESSTEGYIRALQRGCRCVEVDCWDGADGRPVVNHGRTLTSKVLFSDCIAAIGKYAFVSSPYPLIISLEVHCNPEQQVAMSEILKSELGPSLLLEPIGADSSKLPSPEDLKQRILIKVKAGEEADERLLFNEMNGRRERSVSSPLSRPVILDNSTLPNAPLVKSPSSMSPSDQISITWNSSSSSQRQGTGNTTVSASSATEDSDSREGSTSIDRRRKKKTSNIVKPLGDLGVYTRGQKYASFTVPESKSYNHVFSFAERTFENLCRDSGVKAQLEKHNMRYLMRVYPSGFRISSSNFDPNKFWRRGAQMAALNWQTYDLGMQMNDAMFAAGQDQTGYVLKPRELRQVAQPSDSNLDGLYPPRKKEKRSIRFSIDMISAQQLPRSRNATSDQTTHPYIEIEAICADDKAKGVATGEGGQDASARNGMSGIGSPHRRRTKIIPSNGYNPIFNDKFTISLETKFPELVFVRWTVWSSPDSRNYSDRSGALATYTAKLSSLQNGYRHLPLFDNRGEQFMFSTLFCRIQKAGEAGLSVPSGSEDLRAGKVESLKQLGRSVFSRKLSVKRSNSAKRRDATVDQE